MDTTINELPDEMKSLQDRISRVEKYLGIVPGSSSTELQAPDFIRIKKVDEEEMEMRIGQLWLPKLGVFAFLIGVLYLLTLPFQEMHPAIPSIGGYVLALSIYFIAFLIKKNYDDISDYLIAGSAVIAFLSSLRLHFFGFEVVIESVLIEFIFLMFVSVSTLWYSVRNKSVYLTALGVLLGYGSIIVTNNLFIIIPGIIVSSFFITRLSLKYEWKGLLIFGMFLSYIFHFAWFMNNPFIGNPLQPVAEMELMAIFMLAYTIIFAGGIMNRANNKTEESVDVMATLINTAVGYGLFLLTTLIATTPFFAAYHILAAIVFISLACGFWIREKSQDMTFILAMTGYAALSIAIIYQFAKPDSYIFLCWQSLIVLSTAVWFRSKFIVIANFIIFTGTLLVYLASYHQMGMLGLSFGIVSLTSARILNWKKAFLEFNTDKIRNGYLMIALFFIPYTFYWIIPPSFVGLALLSLAIGYFAIGKILKNLKYRYMAVLTLVISAVYLIILGFTNTTVTDKIISFISAGIVLIITSTVYSKLKRNKIIG